MKNPIRLAACAAFTLLTAPLLHAQVPQLVNYQGRVAVGTVNFEGTGTFRFALVNTNGSTVYWSNSPDTAPANGIPDAAVNLTVTKGLYSVLLGDTSVTNMAAIPASVWANADVRLRVWFNDGTNGNQLLTPDQRLAPNGYLADGSVSPAALAAGAVTTAKIAAGAVGNAQIATGIDAAKISTGSFPAISGTNLTGLNAANIGSGTLDDARLSPNVALRNSGNIFTSPQTMNQTLTVGGAYFGYGEIRMWAVEGNGLNGTAYLQARDQSGTSNIGLQLRSQNAGTIVNALRVTPTGNVGIGTTNPGAKLEISNGTTGLRVLPGQLFDDTFKTGDVTLDIPGNQTIGIWDNLSVSSDLLVVGNTYHEGGVGIGNRPLLGLKGALHVDGDYYGKGHVFLHAFEGDGANGVAFLQARDDSGTSSIALQFRTQNTGAISEAMRITPTGAVGIATSTPNKKMEISVPSNDGLRITGAGGNGSNVGIDLTTYDPTQYTNFFAKQPTARIQAVDTNFSSRLEFYTKLPGSPGNDIERRVSIGGGADSLYVEVGGVHAYKARRSDNDYYFDVTSDRRLKTGIKTLTGALDTLERLRPVRFHYTAEHLAKSPNNPDIEHIGVIAQEFQEIFPDYVTKDTDGYLSVKASPIMFVTAAAVKELSAKCEAALKQKDEEIAALKKQLADTTAPQAARDQAIEARLARLEEAAPAATPSTASAATPAAAVVKVALKK